MYAFEAQIECHQSHLSHLFVVRPFFFSVCPHILLQCTVSDYKFDTKKLETRVVYIGYMIFYYAILFSKFHEVV